MDKQHNADNAVFVTRKTVALYWPKEVVTTQVVTCVRELFNKENNFVVKLAPISLVTLLNTQQM